MQVYDVRGQGAFKLGFPPSTPQFEIMVRRGRGSRKVEGGKLKVERSKRGGVRGRRPGLPDINSDEEAPGRTPTNTATARIGTENFCRRGVLNNNGLMPDLHREE
jgi:hypothetical protein